MREYTISAPYCAPARMRPFVLIAALLCAAPGIASANELLNVYNLALQNDTQLETAVHARDAALQAVPLARASLLPQLSARYNGVEGHEEGDSTQSGPYHRGTSSREFSVSLDQTIFNWSASQRLNQASTRATLAQTVYQIAERDLLLRSAQIYFNALSAADNLRFAQAENEAVQRQLDQARKRFEVGLFSVTDVEEAQAAFDLTVARVLQAQQALASSRQALTETTGVHDPKLAPLQEDIPLHGPDPGDVESWIDAALEHNIDLAAFHLSTEIASLGIAVAKAGRLPTIGLGAQLSDGETTRGSSYSDGRDHSVGVNVVVPIFSGFYVQSQVRQAESLHEQNKSEEEGGRRSVERQTRDAYLGVISGVSQVQALRQAVVSGNSALKASEKGLQVGTRTTIDVLNARRDLFSAQRDYARARYDYLRSVLNLKAAAGSLNEGDLAAIDGLLIQQ